MQEVLDLRKVGTLRIFLKNGSKKKETQISKSPLVKMSGVQHTLAPTR